MLAASPKGVVGDFGTRHHPKKKNDSACVRWWWRGDEAFLACSGYSSDVCVVFYACDDGNNRSEYLTNPRGQLLFSFSKFSSSAENKSVHSFMFDVMENRDQEQTRVIRARVDHSPEVLSHNNNTHVPYHTLTSSFLFSREKVDAAADVGL